ncbi:hypothetical protein [Yeosuana marina]|uniref:hypothetical protein n=1 Tax=Yeosuana marina TaxID=1565536 RepID=UPI0030EDC59C|tara:strand:+ start:832 stop:1683 length:852 start_codon:yes stop_codon:yes gene_type:complete
MKNSILYFGFILLIGFSSHAQSKIGKAEESLKKNETSTKNSKTSYSEGENNNDSEGSFFTEVFGGLFVEVFVQAFAYTVYGIAIESPFEQGHQASNAYLSKYPYYKLNTGNYTYEWNEDTPIFRTSLSARYISENSRLKGSQLNLDMRFLKRVELELDYLQLWEHNPNFGNDNLAIYTALAKYHRVRTEKFDAWWGLGTSYIDGSLDRFGFAYGLGAELFFAKPISLEANFNQTFINDDTVNKLNGLINYHLNTYKLIFGYQHLRIGNQNFSTVTLGAGIFLD